MIRVTSKWRSCPSNKPSGLGGLFTCTKHLETTSRTNETFAKWSEKRKTAKKAARRPVMSTTSGGSKGGTA